MGRLCIFGLLCAMWVVSGCQKGNQASPQPTGAVDVIVEGGGAFPASLAGRWKGQKNWEIVLEPDGTVSSAQHGIGGVLVRPKHLSTVTDPERSTHNTYKAGRWLVHYLPDARELRVEIVLDEVHLEWGGVVLDGKVKDVFVGKVSEDGSTWRTEWFSFAEYTTPEHQDTVLAPTEDEIFADAIIFEKVAGRQQ
ncbi:MAG: hypothetical protein IH624_16505 [Phycisphaerae bacterium]|nr:hypothetical protein [Phycisphaerae bacterium]